MLGELGALGVLAVLAVVAALAGCVTVAVELCSLPPQPLSSPTRSRTARIAPRARARLSEDLARGERAGCNAPRLLDPQARGEHSTGSHEQRDAAAEAPRGCRPTFPRSGAAPGPVSSAGRRRRPARQRGSRAATISAHCTIHQRLEHVDQHREQRHAAEADEQAQAARAGGPLRDPDDRRRQHDRGGQQSQTDPRKILIAGPRASRLLACSRPAPCRPRGTAS